MFPPWISRFFSLTQREEEEVRQRQLERVTVEALPLVAELLLMNNLAIALLVVLAMCVSVASPSSYAQRQSKRGYWEDMEETHAYITSCNLHVHHLLESSLKSYSTDPPLFFSFLNFIFPCVSGTPPLPLHRKSKLWKIVGGRFKIHQLHGCAYME